MRFPTRSEVADAAPRVVRAVTTVVRQAPSLASYAVQLSTEAAGGLRERARQRFRGERPAPRGPSEAALKAGAPGAARPFADRVAERAAKRAAAETGERAAADTGDSTGAGGAAAAETGDSTAASGAAAADTGDTGEGAEESGTGTVAAPPEKPQAGIQPDELPISDWDHASMPSLRARVARLTLDELLLLRTYETEHAGRLAVLTMLDNRIAKMDPSRVD